MMASSAPPRKAVVDKIKRLCAESTAHDPTNSSRALGLEDAMTMVLREKGIGEFLHLVISTREEFTRRGPQGLVLVGPRNSGKRALIDQGLEGAERDSLKRMECAEFMHDARERLVMFRKDRSLRLRDPVPNLVEQMTKPKLAGGDWPVSGNPSGIGGLPVRLLRMRFIQRGTASADSSNWVSDIDMSEGIQRQLTWRFLRFSWQLEQNLAQGSCHRRSRRSGSRSIRR